MSRGWTTASDVEVTLARDVASTLVGLAKTSGDICQIFEGLALAVGAPRATAPRGERHHAALKHLLRKHPQLSRIDVTRAFPESTGDLTANVFGQLFQEISALRGEAVQHGVVSTPPVLALDMVALATSHWVSDRLSTRPESLAQVIGGSQTPSKATVGAIASALDEVVWYDPCVGGGVFPVAILILLRRLGVRPSQSLFSRLLASDRDPLAVAVARTRVLLAAATILGKPYSRLRNELLLEFRVEDSLTRLCETLPLDLAIHVGAQGPHADLVIGNPPYVRGDRLSGPMKDFLRNAFPSIAGGTVDLYTYFIAHGLLALRDRGILCYVSPASFQRSQYGKKTREFIARSGGVVALFDFDELPVFEGASVHASVYAIRKNQPQGPAMAHVFTDLPPEEPILKRLRDAMTVPPANISPHGWYLGDDDVNELLALLRRRGTPLIRYAGQILSGIKTGYQRAYIISAAQAAELAADPSSRRFLRPLLRPVSIRRWKTNWDGSHLIFVRKGETLPAGCSLIHHFQRYEAVLSARSDVKGHPTWYGLRECSYYEAFLEPKIVFPDIATECRFAVDSSGFFVPDGAFVLPRADYYLTALLNSCVGRFYFRARCNTIGNPQQGGRLRFKKTYVEDFPVPAPEATVHRAEIEDLSRRLAAGETPGSIREKLDELALDVYQLPQEHERILLENT
jgi:hypothetical protein